MGFLWKLISMIFGRSKNQIVMELIKSQIFGSGTGGTIPGLKDLIARMGEKGLGDIASSWVSTGANKEISPSQVESTLGSDTISAWAKKTGLSVDSLKEKLSKYLPKLVDQATPNGRLPG